MRNISNRPTGKVAKTVGYTSCIAVSNFINFQNKGRPIEINGKFIDSWSNKYLHILTVTVTERADVDI